MELTYTIFVFVAQILIVPFVLLIAFAIWYDFSKSEIPPGVNQPLKLRFLHWVMIVSSFLTPDVSEARRDTSTCVLPGEGMAVAGVLLVLASCICILIPALLFTWIAYRAITRTDMPPGFKLRVTVQLIEMLRDGLLALGNFLEKLGICREFTLVRKLLDGLAPSPDSNLLIKNLIFDDVPVRMYWPKTPVTGQRRGTLFVHGGGGLIGSFREYGQVCCKMTQGSDSVVVCVGFRLVPEHPYPAQVRDCLTAAIHFLKHAEEYGVDSSHIVIVGDSSGGTYAAAVAHELVTRVDLPRLRAQILIYPFLQALDFNLPSHQQNYPGPVISKKVALQLAFRILGKKVTGVDAIMKNAHVSEAMRVKYRKWVSADLIPAEFKVRRFEPPVLAPFSEELHEMIKPVFETRFSPLLVEDAVIRQLPETFILTCEYDIFRDDGLLYKKRLEDNGVPVTWYHAQEGTHGIFILLGFPYLEQQSSRDCFKHVMHFLRSL